VGQGAVAVFMVADQVADARVALHNTADKSCTSSRLKLRQACGIRRDILDTDCRVVETYDMATDDILWGELIQGAVAVNQVVG
jgi:tetrahydromethanopterin S-methyltransferase subunit H